VQIREYDGTTSPSGYKNVGSAVTVVPRGTTTVHMNLLSKQIGFFGSGNTVINVTTVMRNPSTLRGAQIDIVALGRRGFGYDSAFDQKQFRSPGWGAAPDASTAPIDGI